MYTKIIQNTKFVYIFLQRLYKSKFCMIMNIQKIYIKFLYTYKKCTNCTKCVHTQFRLKRA